MKGKSRILSPVTVLLVFAAAAGLMASAIIGGIVPGFVGGYYSHSPTITYQGSFDVNYVGIFHVLQAEPICNSAFPPCFATNETVFFLNAGNVTIRLVFYCGTTKNGFTIAGLYDFCSKASDIQFDEGTCLHVKGTLLQPSSWPSKQYLPLMRFHGDLFVFTYNQVPHASCP